MSSSATPDFGRLASTYDRVRPVDDNWRGVYRVVKGRLDVTGRRVLDVGCGTGRLAEALVDDGARVWGVDASPEMLAVAKQKQLRGAAFRVAHAEKLPFRAGWFERAFMWLSAHLVDRPRAFAESRRVLTRDGSLGVVTFDPLHFGSYWLNDLFPSIAEIDRARFPDRDGLAADLAESGFSDVGFERLSQSGSLSRAEALERVEGRHISTFDLLPAEELDVGTERARRELPERVDYRVEWLLAFARV